MIYNSILNSRCSPFHVSGRSVYHIWVEESAVVGWPWGLWVARTCSMGLIEVRYFAPEARSVYGCADDMGLVSWLGKCRFA